MNTTQQQIDYGGAAFPSTNRLGMTLRDWFAGMALQAMLSDWVFGENEPQAQVAYKMADAMIEARKKDYIIDRGEDK